MRPGEGGPGNGTDQYPGRGQDDRPPYGNSQFGGPAGAPFGGYGGAGPEALPPEVTHAPPVKQGRPGLIVFVAFLVQLVLVAAVGNQWTTDRLTDFREQHTGLAGVFAGTPQAFSWRFTPRDGDRFHVWGAQLAGLGAGFLIAALLIFALVRGAITFGRAFFGVWLAVIVATLLGSMVFRAVVAPSYLGDIPGLGDGGKERLVSVLYRGGGTEIPAGIALGFVVALIAALVAIISRRKVAVAVPLAAVEPDRTPEPEAPPPYYGEPAPAERSDGSDSRTLSMQKVQDSTSGPVDQRHEPYRRPDDDRSNAAPFAAGAGVAAAGAAGAVAAHEHNDDTKDTDDDRRAQDASQTQALPVHGASHDADTTQQPSATEPSHDEPSHDEPSHDEPPQNEPPQNEPPRDGSPATQAIPVAAEAPAEHRPDGGRETPAVEPDATQAVPVQPEPPAPSEHAGVPSDGQEPGTAAAGPEATQALPAQHDAPPYTRTGQAPDTSQTQAFPRPPDDEDMGQHPDHHD